MMMVRRRQRRSYEDEDWEENLARETALEKIKRKKDKEFRREMVRKSIGCLKLIYLLFN